MKVVGNTIVLAQYDIIIVTHSFNHNMISLYCVCV
jgi:hypothetical protein